LDAESEGERLAVLAWLRAGAPEAAYKADAFPLPDDMKEMPMTPQFVAAGKTVQIKKIIDTRCVRCHGPEGTQNDKPLDSYEALKPYLPTRPAAAQPARQEARQP